MHQTLKHLHIMVKAQVDNPYALSVEGLKHWIEVLIKNQDMEIIIGPNVVMVDDEGNEGPTGSANIKTSHFAFHIWENLGVIQADLYTCGELDIGQFLDEFEVFDPVVLEYLVMDREDGFKIIESGKY